MNSESRMIGSASFDRSGRYRYLLSREWDPRLPRVAFVMLNPNRADARADDPTIRRCVGFARGWGYGGVDVVNLFAVCAPQPALLKSVDDPVGPRNDRFLRRICRQAPLTVAAWGVHGALHNRAERVIALLGRHANDLVCLGLTKAGHPRHPLYLPGDTVCRPF